MTGGGDSPCPPASTLLGNHTRQRGVSPRMHRHNTHILALNTMATHPNRSGLTTRLLSHPFIPSRSRNPQKKKQKLTKKKQGRETPKVGETWDSSSSSSGIASERVWLGPHFGVTASILYGRSTWRTISYHIIAGVQWHQGDRGGREAGESDGTRSGRLARRMRERERERDR